MAEHTTNVLIVGAGPVGLFLATELRLHGVDSIVIDRLDEPSQTIKAGSVGPQSAELFDRRGLLEPMQAAMAGVTLPTLPPGTKPVVGHFSGLFLLHGAPEITTPALIAPQSFVELVLGAAAAETTTVLRRHELVAIEQNENSVLATVHDGANTITIACDYLIGCDGGRSTTRKLAGFAFPGTPPTITGRQALVEIAEPNPLQPGWNRTETGMVVFGPGPNRILTVEFDGPPEDRDAPVTAEELSGSLSRTSGASVTVTSVQTATRWTDNTRLVDDYRAGRVLLAGDAAHIHPPFGGQGLNLGFMDAGNLGWKLAARLAGDADDTLLDSYTAERRPVAARALQNTRAQVALMRPDPQTSALRELFTELLEYDDANAHISRMMTSQDAVYPMASEHPLAGRLISDLPLPGGSRLFEAMRDGRGVLLDASDDGRFTSAAAAWGTRLTMLRAHAADGTSALIRPDGIVAWADSSALWSTADELVTATATWFGPAEHAAAAESRSAEDSGSEPARVV